MSSAFDGFGKRVSGMALLVFALAGWVALVDLVEGRGAHAAPVWSGAAVSQGEKGAEAGANQLRVCADPNNLPFSNDRGEGFENRLAELVARRLGWPLRYTYFPQRRGFIKHTLQSGACDVVMSVPTRFERTENTAPYYRSSYVFITRRAQKPPASLDDPALRSLRIGLHVVGDDYANVPPAEALARRGIVDNVHGYSIYGDYSKPHPTQSLLDALESNELDVAIAWGPLAGSFVKSAGGELTMTPVRPERDAAGLAMSFSISMGVRHGDTALRHELERVLTEERARVQALLVSFGVPFEAPPAPRGEPG